MTNSKLLKPHVSVKYYFFTMWILSPITTIEIVLGCDLLRANMDRRNIHSGQQLFKLAYGCVNIVLRQTEKM